MNKLTIIGNLVRDPETKTVGGSIPVCTFTVAVNRKGKDGKQEADFFRVTAWRGLSDICSKYLSKGKKVCVVGPVTVNTYSGQDGQPRASLEVTAEDVEFLTPKGVTEGTAAPESKDEFVNVDEASLPF